jgi:putative membrane protein
MENLKKNITDVQQNVLLDTSSRTRDHLANERTFLAWIRTSIGIMAFGFVVEKFTLFLKQITFFLAKEHFSELSSNPAYLQGYSSIFGIFLVALGSFICLLAFIKYKRVEKQINKNIFYPSKLLDIMLMLSVLSVGIFLAIYLSNSI